MPQPRGEVITDTIQSVWQVYVYLDNVGSKVADRETDRYTLRKNQKNIFDDFLLEHRAFLTESEGFPWPGRRDSLS